MLYAPVHQRTMYPAILPLLWFRLFACAAILKCPSAPNNARALAVVDLNSLGETPHACGLALILAYWP